MKFNNPIPLIVLVLLVMLSGKINAQQNIDVPQVVVSAFEKNFPSAIGAKWEKLENTVYEVSFIVNSNQYEATFTSVGSWLKTEKIVDFNTFPSKVTTEFKAKFPNVKIVEASLVETAKMGNLYGVEFDNGKEKLEAFFNEKGEYVLLEDENFKN